MKIFSLFFILFLTSPFVFAEAGFVDFHMKALQKVQSRALASEEYKNCMDDESNEFKNEEQIVKCKKEASSSMKLQKKKKHKK